MAQKFLFALVFLCSPLCSMENWSIRDYYEYSALEKSNFLWEKITKSAYQNNLPARAHKIFCLIDELSSTPGKKLEGVGSVAKIKLVPLSNYFSGIFSSGALGLMYLALHGSSQTILENLNIKFLIDNSLSLNLKISRDIITDAYLAFNHEFISYDREPNVLGQNGEKQIKKLASRSSNGKLAFEPRAPSHLTFVPSKTLLDLQCNAYNFREALAQLQCGLLYEVYTLDFFNMPWHIADIMLESEFISSQYADRELFIIKQ